MTDRLAVLPAFTRPELDALFRAITERMAQPDLDREEGETLRSLLTAVAEARYSLDR